MVGTTTSRLIFESVDDALDAIPQVRNVEVDKQSKPVATQAEIREQLGRVNRQQFFDTFDLDDEAIFDNEIDSIRGGEFDSAIHNRQPNLVLKLQAVFSELLADARMVGALEYACAKNAVNLHRAADDTPAGNVGMHEINGLCVLGVLCVPSAFEQPRCPLSNQR